MLTSQYGDVQTEILVFGETKSVEAFIKDYFGYHHDLLPLTFVVLALYPILLASLFAVCIAKLNFQRRMIVFILPHNSELDPLLITVTPTHPLKLFS
ncbi:hypothetical protein L1987_20134 [Smallanthus sonchifolius]|uniref:Uncharacterized protein n=1 Tax=Smallanthus sonchifolius TaxID=185202 RepID=A0ACB9IQK9_9ASTR|nr:hypothetical protein L1987_20134 [Smallanthus sonchifolius]